MIVGVESYFNKLFNYLFPLESGCTDLQLAEHNT